MTNTGTDTMRTLSDQVAEEIRVALTRRKMSQRKLAQELGVSAAWLNYRLTGVQAIDLNDLQRIADVLGVTVVELLPPAIVRPNNRSTDQVGWPMSGLSAPPTRPKGRPVGELTRPVSPAPPTLRRPAPVERPVSR